MTLWKGFHVTPGLGGLTEQMGINHLITTWDDPPSTGKVIILIDSVTAVITRMGGYTQDIFCPGSWE